jgi:hypothetical protein
VNPLKLVTTRRRNLLDSWDPYIPKRNAKSAAGSANLVGVIYDVGRRRRKKRVRIAHGPCTGFITLGCGQSSFFFTALRVGPIVRLRGAVDIMSLSFPSCTIFDMGRGPSLFPFI